MRAKLRRGEFIMYKKFLRLALTGALLFQTGNICTFAYNKDEFDATGSSAKVDYCKNFPKNQYGQTVDIDCAFTQLMHNQKASGGRNPGKAIKIGPNGDHEIRMWHKQHIFTLGETLKHWIKNSGENILKYTFIGDLIEKTRDFLSLNSTVLAAEVAKNWALAPYFKGYNVTPEDVELWKNAYIKLPRFTPDPNYTDYEECKFFYPIRYFCKKNFQKKQELAELAFNESLLQKIVQMEREAEIKAKAYYLLMNQIFRSMKNYNEEQDTLVGVLDFSEDNYEAQAYFTNIGLSQKINKRAIEGIYSDTENSLDSVAKKENKNNEEDL